MLLLVSLDQVFPGPHASMACILSGPNHACRRLVSSPPQSTANVRVKLRGWTDGAGRFTRNACTCEGFCVRVLRLLNSSELFSVILRLHVVCQCPSGYEVSRAGHAVVLSTARVVLQEGRTAVPLGHIVTRVTPLYLIHCPLGKPHSRCDSF